MVTPYNDSEEKVSQVQRMFNRIAPTYDKLNHIVSLGLDPSWRRKAIAMLAPYQPQEVLDVATGTGDLAIDILQQIPSVRSILGVDISEEMMRYGEDKVRSLGLETKISFKREDCTALTLDSESFDAVTIGFGIRNFEDIPAAARELHRVLRPGKPVVILELTEPRNKLMHFFYRLYANRVIPFLGQYISEDRDAYTYLPRSIEEAPQREEMVQIFLNAGFREAYYRNIAPGTCAIYVAIK